MGFALKSAHERFRGLQWRWRVIVAKVLYRWLHHRRRDSLDPSIMMLAHCQSAATAVTDCQYYSSPAYLHHNSEN